MTDGFEDELARLAEQIAEDDARDGPDAEWRAAGAVYKKADLIEWQIGGDAALPVYEDVVRRLPHRVDPGPRALLIGACAIAVLRDRADRDSECRAAAKAMVVHLSTEAALATQRRALIGA